MTGTINVIDTKYDKGLCFKNLDFQNQGLAQIPEISKA